MFNKLRQLLNGLKSMHPLSAFKVAGISGSALSKDIQITYQVNGKSTISTELPTDLINQLMYLKGFTKEDSNLIYNLAVSEMLCPCFRILSIDFSVDPINFLVEDIKSKYTFIFSPEEIIASSEIIGKFSSADISKIYFHVTSEYTRQYEKQISSLKRKIFSYHQKNKSINIHSIKKT